MDIKDKIRKLLALADSPNDNEAIAALSKARELMARHKLTERDIDIKSSEVVTELLDIYYTARSSIWVLKLARVIAESCCCKSYSNRMYRKKTMQIGIVGFKEDTEVCKKLITYAYEHVCGRISEIKRRLKNENSAAEITQRGKAYGIGFAEGLNQAIAEQHEANQEYGLVLITPKEVNDKLRSFAQNTRVSYGIDPDAARFRLAGRKEGYEYSPRERLRDA